MMCVCVPVYTLASSWYLTCTIPSECYSTVCYSYSTCAIQLSSFISEVQVHTFIYLYTTTCNLILLSTMIYFNFNTCTLYCMSHVCMISVKYMCVCVPNPTNQPFPVSQSFSSSFSFSFPQISFSFETHFFPCVH